MADATSGQKVQFPDHDERTPTVLVVDDEVLIRLVMSDFLQECGFKVLEAGTAAEAVAILESQAVTIDLVFSDVRMPGEMDGFGLAKWIRENRKGLPVLLASGEAKKAEVAQDLCAQEPFLSKPYDLKMVVGQIRQMLDARQSK